MSPGAEEQGTIGIFSIRRREMGTDSLRMLVCHLKSGRAMQNHIEGTKCPYGRYASIGYRLTGA